MANPLQILKKASKAPKPVKKAQAKPTDVKPNRKEDVVNTFKDFNKEVK